MTRNLSPYELASATAFPGDAPVGPTAVVPVHVRLRPYAVAFVAGFPASIGGLSLFAAFSRSGSTDGAFPLGVVLLAAATALLVLGRRSRLSIDGRTLSVRFFGLRTTTVRLSQLRSATFAMAWPSISFAITLVEHGGRRALVHANWWEHEKQLLVPLCRALADGAIPMDRDTSRIVARTLRMPAPQATIVHRPFLRRGKTW